MTSWTETDHLRHSREHQKLVSTQNARPRLHFAAFQLEMGRGTYPIALRPPIRLWLRLNVPMYVPGLHQGGQTRHHRWGRSRESQTKQAGHTDSWGGEGEARNLDHIVRIRT